MRPLRARLANLKRFEVSNDWGASLYSARNIGKWFSAKGPNVPVWRGLVAKGNVLGEPAASAGGSIDPEPALGLSAESREPNRKTRTSRITLARPAS